MLCTYCIGDVWFRFAYTFKNKSKILNKTPICTFLKGKHPTT